MDKVYINKNKYGIACGASSYLLWGVLPIYWKFVQSVPAFEILAHRILWSFVFIMIIVLFKGSLSKVFLLLKDKKSLIYLCLCSVLITLNWFLYIWCVNSNHIVDSSLGYYINPLMSIFLGTFVLKEKLDRTQKAALIIAAVGVLTMIVVYGSFPWIPISLAASFAIYGLCKKHVNADASVGMAVETAIIAPLALIFLLWTGFSGKGAFGGSIWTTILLMLSGVVTAMPLLLFAEGARKIKLSTMGFLQYISPTISLIIGVFMYNEQVTQVNMLGFVFIWAALVIYSYSLLKHKEISV